MEFLSVILTAAVVDNFCLTKFLGFNEASEAKGDLKLLGALLTLVTMVSAAVGSALNVFVLGPAGLDYLKTFVFVLVSLVVSLVVKMAFGAKLADVDYTFVCANSAVLGTCLLTAEMDVFTACLTGLGAGLGVMLAMFVLKGITDNMNEKDLPKAFRGVPAQILAAGIMAMAFFAFK